MSSIELLERRLERERMARKQAESILEQKALELYRANEDLKRLNENLEKRVSERTLELALSEDKYRGIIENMDLGILEVDDNDIIVKAYSRFARLTGYSPDELIGKKAAEVFTPNEDNKNIILNQNENRKEGSTGVYEVQIRRKDGELIWVIISGAPIYDMQGNVTGSIGVHLDITERKKLERDLILAKNQAEEAQIAEKQFLANMSHEIRTPLNAIIGMSHLLYDTRPTPQQVDFLNALKTSADLLHSLISDILDFSKIETGNVDVRENPFDLVGLVRTLQKTFQLKMKDKPIKIEAFLDASIQPVVVGDELLLNQILLNLVGNAEKFTESGKIGIKASVIEEEFGFQTIEFEVYDTGIGIDDDKLPLIFNQFKQLDNENRQKHKGTGLGLAITKRLIELQGGHIEAQSQKGKGTTFTFSVTYKVTNDAPSIITGLSKNEVANESQLNDNQNINGLHVLIAEDNLMNQKYLTNLLKKWEVSYALANNGREAITAANQEKYDLIFMDIQMPIVDGFEATIAIRNTNNLNQSTPIIALTASALSDQKIQAMSIGMNDYISKPFGPTQIQEALSKYMNAALIEEKKENTFSFNKGLDKVYLEELYLNDYEYASEMFEIFISQYIKEFNAIETLIENESWKEAKQMLHKIKPSFSMVGLTSLTAKVQHLEDKTIAKEINKTLIIERYQEIKREIHKYLPMLESDLEKMRIFQSHES